MASFKIILRGKVQGVGFRQYIYQKALQYNISGFVQNQNDKSVLIEACSEKENINIFIELCKKGPQRAIVSNFSKIDLPEMSYKTFEIR